MNTQPKHDKNSPLELLRLARNLETAIERMDAFSSTTTGVRAVTLPHYNAVMRAAHEMREFMK